VNTYRWIVTVRRNDVLPSRRPYVREVHTEGPRPNEAAVLGLERIVSDDNDLWQSDNLTISVERVR
jgi:hypothetical protein